MGRKVWQESSAVYDVFSMHFKEIKLAAHNPDPTRTKPQREMNVTKGADLYTDIANANASSNW